MQIIVRVMFLAAACCISVCAAQDETNRVFDCGVNTIYLVRRLKGMDADLTEISGHLARDAEKGSSIYDLETYLHSVGIKTDARLMRLSDLCRKRSALAILLTHRNDGMGHFVVARVLADGQLQIIDSLLGTSIEENAPTNKERLPIILIDPQDNGWRWKFFALVSVSMLGVLGFGFIKRKGAGTTDEHK